MQLKKDEVGLFKLEVFSKHPRILPDASVQFSLTMFALVDSFYVEK